MAIITNDPITNEYGMTINNCYIRAGKKLKITAVEEDDNTTIYSIETTVETFLNKDAKLNFKEPMSTEGILFSVDKLGDNIYEEIYDDLKRRFPNYTDDL
jgi:sulfite reductase alpha subunit-like flavoprotein